MRVLIAVPYIAGGGAERVATIWANGLIEFGDEVILASFYPVSNEYAVNPAVKIIYLFETKNLYKKASILQKVKSIRSIVKREQPDIIIPLVTYIGITYHLSTLGIKTIFIETIRNNPFESKMNWLTRLLRNWSVYYAKAVIFQNVRQKEYFCDKLHGAKIVLPNPIPHRYFFIEKKYVKTPIHIISVGRLEKQKNYSMLIEVMRIVVEKKPGTVLEIYGEGNERRELENKINDYNLENNIILRGRTEKILEKLSSADIFIMCSNYEGMPNALMEAMTIGLPCISTDCATGPRELIEDGINGYLTPIQDIDMMVQKLLYILNNYAEAVLVGKKAKETMIQFKDERIIYSLQSFLKQLIEEGK